MEKITNINENELIKTINYRPNTEIYFTLICGVGLLFVPYLPVRFLAVVFIGLALFCHVKLKDHKSISFAEDYILIYEDDDTANKIYFNEINEWGIRPNNATCGCIQFLLNDDSIHYVYSFQVEKARKELIRLINHLETGEKALQARAIHRDGIFKKTFNKVFKK